MDPKIWGPHYWFFLHTVALHYPIHPTSIQKKMYHRLIHHFSEFIPNHSIKTVYESLLQKYPVTPYLDTRKDFVQWVHHLHNKVNQRLDKPTITLEEYYESLKPKKKPWIFLFILFLLFVYGVSYTFTGTRWSIYHF